jgi:hypothetical protein
LRIGTRSVLYGAHCFFIHPVFVWLGWCKLYGFTLDPRIVTACVVHDLGYFGCPNIDGKEGKVHPELGARIMGLLFDHCTEVYFDRREWNPRPRWRRKRTWHDFSLYHSRWYADMDCKRVSKLAAADKMAFCLEPWWLYLPRVWASGEIHEFFTKPGCTLKERYFEVKRKTLDWVLRETVA